MILSFTLTMPNVGSWNGKWTGEGNLYAITRRFTGRDKVNAEKILEKGSFYYDFGDGWGAAIEVRRVYAQEAVKIRRNSQGFCGYEWMVDSIIHHGKILNSSEQKAL